MTADLKKMWYAVDVLIQPAAAEAVEFAFNELETLGTEIDSLRKSPDEPLCVTGFFADPPDILAVREGMAESLSIHDLDERSILSVSSRNIEDTDWLAEWKKHWKPQSVGRFTVSPPWSTVDDRDRMLITIEPNMAFGTGTHETTQLCLMAIGEKFRPEQSFLDVGTGTGILAIAAAKMGGRKIVACDVDHDSVAIARQNAFDNNVGASIEFFEGTVDDESAKFDFVCANLTLDVILPLLPTLAAKSKSTLLLSGILAQQESAAVDALTTAGFSDFDITSAGEWIAITVSV